MTVPEAAMNETDSSEPTEDQVRRPRELPIVKTVPEAARMQRAAEDQLGLRVPAADSCHHSRTDRSINYVRHELTCFAGEKGYHACISQNVVEAIKKDRIILRHPTWGEAQRAKAPDTLPHSRHMDQSQRRTPLSQLAPRCSRLPGDRPVKRPPACPSATDQP